MHRSDLTGGAYHIDPVLDDYATQGSGQGRGHRRLPDQRACSRWRKRRSATVRSDAGYGWYWSVGLTDEFALPAWAGEAARLLRGTRTASMLMDRLCQGQLERLDYRSQRSLSYAQQPRATTSVRRHRFYQRAARCDFAGLVWYAAFVGFGRSRVTVGISPDMFAEFIFSLIEARDGALRFDLLRCCEPMDNHRSGEDGEEPASRVGFAVGQQADHGRSGHDTSDSLKVSPTPLSMLNLDEDHVRKELRVQLQAAGAAASN